MVLPLISPGRESRPKQLESCRSLGSPDDLKSLFESSAFLAHCWVILYLILPLGSFAQSKAIQETIANWGGKTFSKEEL